ncbi:MAG: tetratricopeptide repeat protein [Sulfuritalea sp.]|jgi:tetratricopeptide (TPR) repeat protein|nr:tetratricopeptide repeat protein [Sulfuritalea sp.]
MSLLMDALKKAELAKRQGQSEGAGSSTAAGAPDGLTLEPMAGSSEPESGSSLAAEDSASSEGNLPHLPSHLEELDAKFLAEAERAASARLRASPPVPLAGPLTDQAAAAADTASRATAAAEPRLTPSERDAPQSRSAAQNLFAAKQVAKPPARKSFAIAVGAITVLSVLGIGGYFWWQLQPKSALIASRAPPSPPPAVVSKPAAVAPAPTLGAPPIAPVAGVPRAAGPATEDKEDDSAAVASKAPARARRAIPAAAPAEPDGPVRVTRAPLKVNPALIRGFDAFNRGDLATAQIEYERAQKSDPRNTDALHGLAAIAVRQGRLDQAESLYRQITEADPHDTVAMSALINMRGQIDPSAAESRLKSLSAAQPELAAPHFSLGNLYARHGRWNEAQQAYFRAYSAEPDNPDILYNLAISLEHLRQNKLAAQYYGQAIAAAQTRPAGFDKAQATARLNTLQP